MISALLLAAAVLAGGTAVTGLYDHRTWWPWRLPAGACIGLAALGLIGFIFASWFGLHPWVVVLAALPVAAPAALLLSPSYRHRLQLNLAAPSGTGTAPMRAGPATVGACTVYAAGVAVLWRIAERTMFAGPEGIYTGVSHNIGDLPFHLSVTSRFVYGDNFPLEHPSFAGASFTYPFLADFIGGMFVVSGLSMRHVIVWSTFLLCLAFAGLLYRWTLTLTGSRGAAFLAPLLALMSGGLGWSMFVSEALRDDVSAWTLLGSLPHDYTITYDTGHRWGNLVTSLLVTQRGLLLGLPLALVVFENWWHGTEAGADAPERRRRMIAAGTIGGLLPLVHAHGFAVVVGLALCLAILSRDWRLWLPFFVLSLGLGLPQVWWVARASGIRGEAFLAWSIGWDRGEQPVLLFWLKNTGLLIPLILAALCWRSEPPIVSRRLLLYYLPFTLCFFIPNVLRLAPWIWDNIKVLTFWFVGSVPLVSLLLARLGRGGAWRGALVALLCAALTGAGALDLWRVASGAFENRVFDRDGIEMAAVLRRVAPPEALILHAPVHNHAAVLAGRRSLMGYPGHVWSHGLDGSARAADIKRIYAGTADADRLLAKYGVDYVIVGPPERAAMPVADRSFEKFPKAGEAGGYRLYYTGYGQN